MKVNEEQRLRERDTAFHNEMEAAPPFSTLWCLRISAIESQAMTAVVKPGNIILSQDRHGSCHYMYCEVLERTAYRVRVRWQQCGVEQWIPYLWTYKGNKTSPLRNETTEYRYLSALRAGRVTR